MSLAEKVAASRKIAKKEAEEAAEREIMNNRYIAKTIMKAKKKGETPSRQTKLKVWLRSRREW